jgi:hypothetical protein
MQTQRSQAGPPHERGCEATHWASYEETMGGAEACCEGGRVAVRVAIEQNPLTSNKSKLNIFRDETNHPSIARLVGSIVVRL